jgi:hypothetical protein
MLARSFVVAFAIALVAAAPAGAVTLAVTPAAGGLQAGGSPDVSVNVGFPSSPQNVTLAFAPGLYANPTVTAPCANPAAASNGCTPVATGTVAASALGLVGVTAPANLYLVAPQGSDLAGVELVVNASALGIGVATISAYGGASLRTSPDTGLDLTFNNLPESAGGIPLTINGLSLTLHGTVAGKAFTRLPTGCGAATSSVSATYYSGAPSDSATSAFTPSGCSSEAYTPTVTASITKDAADQHAVVALGIAQPAGQAATKSIAIALPSGVGPYFTASQECPSGTALASCPATSTIGIASAVTPILASPLSGRVVLLAPPAGNPLPGVGVVFGSPAPIALTGTVALTGASITVTVPSVPDVPLTGLGILINGGASGLLTTNCQPGTLNPVLTPYGGPAYTTPLPVTPSGCGSGSGAGGGAGGGGGSPGAKLPSATTNGTVAISSTTAVLLGIENGNGAAVTRCIFQFGRTSKYQHSITCAQAGGSGSIQVSALIANLHPLVRYHYRVAVTTSAGTTRGVDRSFVTQGCRVPNVTGDSVAGATALLKRAGCQLGKVSRPAHARGVVKRSSPSAGAAVSRGARVALLVG